MDSKAVSALIGFVLMLAIIMGFIGIMQSKFVPEWNKDVEAKHLDKLSYEIADLSEAVSLAASTGNPAKVVLDAGVEYPEYYVLVSPSKSSSTISSRKLSLNISGTINSKPIDISFQTHAITVRPNYLYLPKSILIFEHSAVIREDGGKVIPESDQSSFSKMKITLYIINTTFNSISTTQIQNLILYPVSYGGSAKFSGTITIECFDENTASWWGKRLSAIYGDSNVNVKGNVVEVIVSGIDLAINYYIIHASYGEESSETWTLQPYILERLSEDQEVYAGTTVMLGIRVLDEYYNPVRDAQVIVESNYETVMKMTDRNGEVWYTYNAGSSGTFIVRFSVGTLSTEYTIRVNEQPSGGAGKSLYSISWEKDEYIITFSGAESQKQVVMRANATPVLTNVSVEFASDQPEIYASFNPKDASTDDTGWVTTTLTVFNSIFSSPDEYYKIVNAYVLSWFAGDIAVVKVYRTLTWIITSFNDFLDCEFSNTQVIDAGGGDGYVTLNTSRNWLAGWSYRRPITIQEVSGNSLTNYQVRIQLNSANFDFSKSNGDDIRFTLEDGLTLLNYWVERWDSVNGEAIIWVKIPNIPAGSNVTIYMYYGNPSARSRSNGDAVFEFFDDLETWDGWGDLCHGGACGEVTQTTKYKYEGMYALEKRTYCDPRGGKKDLGFNLSRDNLAVEFHRLRIGGDGTDCYCDRTGVEDSEENGYSVSICHGSQPYIFVDVRNGGIATITGKKYVQNDILSEWYIAQLILTSDQVKARILDTDYSLLYETSTNNKRYSVFTQIAIRGGRPYYVDIIKIRKYVEPEPVVTVGNEEITTYISPGYVKSYVKDLSQNSTIYFLQWDGNLPSGTEMEFWIRASNESFGSDSSAPPWVYVGKASDGRTFDLKDENIVGRYIQWNVSLSGSVATPILDEVTVGYLPSS